MVSLHELAGPFGVEIRGVDLARPLSRNDERAIIDALHDNQAIVVRGQSLNANQFLRYGECFGRPHPHVLDHLHLPGYPGILPLTNVAPDGGAERNYNGAAFWHTDQSYEAEPASATILYAIKIPAVGGETQIANMALAYDALGETMKERIDGLTALHRYGNRDAGRPGENTATPLVNDRQRRKVPPVRHALVRRHPVTGRKALYAPTGTSRGILGMPEDEARDLLGELRDHALKPAFRHAHKYAVGDVIAWDTLATVHRAPDQKAATGPADTRLLHRISVKGLPPCLGWAQGDGQERETA